MAAEFTLESVRQYMLAHEGRVTNHDLVKHYKAWLTHPTLKESSRQKFKEYVNTLSTIKVEEGVKYLVLKRKFFPTFAEPSPQNTNELSLLDEVLGAYDRRSGQPPQLPPVYKAPPPPNYRQPPPPPPPSHVANIGTYPTSPNFTPSPTSPNYPAKQYHVQDHVQVPMDYGLPLPSDFGLPNPRQGVFHPPPGSSYYVPPVPVRNMSRSSSVMSSDLSRSSSRQALDLGSHDPPVIPPPLPQRNTKEASPSMSSSVSMASSTNSSRKASMSEDKENELEKEKISVKERTKTFNRMASEVEVTKVKEVTSIPDQKRRKNSNRNSSRAQSQNRDDYDHDSSSISTLDQVVKQWMVAAAKCDYTTLFKMLRDDPRLAKAKDFTSGYTALHWACKHGNLDLVKLLAGQYGANTNIRSHGGYTPLHLACQFDHQEVFDILVKAYGADPNLRDYAGKKARQYMATIGHGLHNMSNDTFRQLKDRRKNRSRQLADKNSGPSGILRFGSLSVKVKKTTEAFNNYFNHSEKKHSQDNQPYSLPTIGIEPESSKSEKMPPPKFAPIKKRKSKRSVDYKQSVIVRSASQNSIKEEKSDSDGEYGFDSQWSTTSSTNRI